MDIGDQTQNHQALSSNILDTILYCPQALALIKVCLSRTVWSYYPGQQKWTLPLHSEQNGSFFLQSFSCWLMLPNSKGIRQSVSLLPFFPLTPNSLNKSGCLLKPVGNAMWTLKTSYLLIINNRKTNPVLG